VGEHLVGLVHGVDAAGGHDHAVGGQERGCRPDHRGAEREQVGSADPARAITGGAGVREDEPTGVVAQDEPDHGFHVVRCQLGRELDQEPPAGSRGEARVGVEDGGDGVEDLPQPADLLQGPQAWGVGRGDVDDDVVRRPLPQAREAPHDLRVLRRGLPVRRGLELADVDPQRHRRAGQGLQVRDDGVRPGVGEAHRVDQVPPGEPVDPWPSVAPLRPQRHRADLDESGREVRLEGRVYRGVLVVPGRDAERVREAQAVQELLL
jgi:hypothetical protein